MKAAGEREGEGSGKESQRDKENNGARERSKDSAGDRKEGSREKDNDRNKDNSKDKESDNTKDNKKESLQVITSGKLPSRSQSPALTDLRVDQIQSAVYQEPTSASTSSKHSSEKSHHSKSHSKDLGSSPGVVTMQPIQPARSMEDSPQKQLLTNLSALAEYGGIISSPGLPSGYQSANISYVLSGDEYSSLQPGFRDHLEYHPALLSSLAQQGQFISEDDHFQGGPQTDEGDGAGSSGSSRAANAITHLNNKVERTKDLIKLEQTFRDDNVNEYLKLAANADKQQLQRIKAVFEKKNQKSAHSIAQLQKKLDGYHKKIKNWETHGSSCGQGSHRQPREMLRDMGQGLKNVGGNIRDGITGLGGSVMSKPREFAHLIKNKFGSADNINQMAARNNWAEGRRIEGESGGAHTLPGALRADQSTPAAPHPSQNKLTSEEGSECSSVTSESIPGYQNQSGSNNLAEGVFTVKPILAELQDRRVDVENLFEKMKTITQEVSYLSSALQEERFRCERLEEQINDLTELHQNEVENLKQALADVEEKVQYQSEERVRDIHEMLELCQTKISKMEHQAMQQQQYVNLEGIEGFNARVLAVKLINVVLTVLQVVLLLVATAAGILMPFLRTRVRILTTSMVVIGAVFILKQWPEVWEISTHLMEKLRKTVVNNENINR
ncbi:transmembrane and coiled-coil domain 2 protein Dmtn isoform X3 [Arctopsyche grandis]|uniref:transmembrane and coiled-coil domain 2 protein Dmtn isoform X3 n=1 Tax=Arctopsyche grandis TaxID=121162 RepID=UPI00406DA3B0